MSKLDPNKILQSLAFVHNLSGLGSLKISQNA